MSTSPARAARRNGQRPTLSRGDRMAMDRERVFTQLAAEAHPEFNAADVAEAAKLCYSACVLFLRQLGIQTEVSDPPSAICDPGVPTQLYLPILTDDTPESNDPST